MRICPECGRTSDDPRCPDCRVATAAIASPEDVVDPLVGEVFADRFRVERRIGAGGMGAVYEAEQVSMGRKVALKVLHSQSADPEAVRRFYREARATSRVEHPNTVRVFDFGTDANGRQFLAMELLSGVSLRSALRTSGALPLPRTVRIALQIAKALGAAHQTGLVHRDLKPENIFLEAHYGETDFARVLDFGIAAFMEGHDQTGPITRAGSVIGTVDYMSPEQVTGHPVDGRSDLFALGVVIYECATGKLPFPPARDVGNVTACVARCKPGIEAAALADCPECLRPLVAALLDPDPLRRPADASVVVAHLEALGTSPTGVSAPPRRHRGRVRSAVAAGLALVVVAAAVVVAIAGRNHAEEPASPAPGEAPDGGVTPSISRPAPPTDAAGPTAVAATSAEAEAVAVPSRSGAAAAPETHTATMAVPEGMVLVPAGRYPLGCQPTDSGCYPDERPGRTVDMPAFAIGRTEVTVAEYTECVAAGQCPPARSGGACNAGIPGREGHPQNCVPFEAAERYCAYRGFLLPTEREWEAAARGPEGREYAWGAEAPACDRTVMASAEGPGCGRGTTHPVGSRPADTAPSGALDMGGNVREWTADWLRGYPGSVGVEPLDERVNRGGSYELPAADFATTHTRLSDVPGAARPDLGFRCATDL